MLEQAQSSTSRSALEIPWEAQLAEANLIQDKAQLAEGDTCTPGLALLFEDAAFAKLSATSARVKSAAATIRRLEKEHEADLAGQDMHIGSEDFQALLARLVEHRISHIQLEIERLVRIRMDVDALMPTLAERPMDQGRLKKTLVKSASTIDMRVARLLEWVTGSFVPANLLVNDVKALRESAAEWDLDAIRRGIFPWDEDTLGVGSLTISQLISRLVLYNKEKRRSVEELKLLKQEKASSLRLYEKQEEALRRGLDKIKQEQEQSELEGESARSGGGSCEVAMRCGQRLLFERRLQQVMRVAGAAKGAFGNASVLQAIGQAEECAPDFLNEEGAVSVAESDADDVFISDDED